MFQFAGFASYAYGFSARSRNTRGVAPFGDLWINACSRLPRAYRSVPRPSSPLGAKASTKCPYPLPPLTRTHKGTSKGEALSLKIQSTVSAFASNTQPSTDGRASKTTSLYMSNSELDSSKPLRLLKGCAHTVVEVNGIEPMTSCLQSRRSPN